MTMPLGTLREKLRELASGRTSYTAFGSFLLYVVGYLTLRFHLAQSPPGCENIR
jgi:hypothetical protein